jgi:hypothetical protein
MSPRCPECSRPMRLVSVLCSRGLANAQTYPPVRTFECAACEKDMIIWQGQPAPPDRNTTSGNPMTDTRDAA